MVEPLVILSEMHGFRNVVPVRSATYLELVSLVSLEILWITVRCCHAGPWGLFVHWATEAFANATRPEPAVQAGASSGGAKDALPSTSVKDSNTTD